MTTLREHTVQCISPAGLHRMAYTEWGDAANPNVLLCAHGLSRSGRDFDDLARALSPHYRVVCPDVAGRGNSGWLANPMHYQIPQYVADMVTLIARLNPAVLHWVGTSMGGLIGMGLAALPASPISKLVLNDVGPVLKAAALKRIGEYLGQAPVFADFARAEKYIRAVSASFGLKTDAQWKTLTQNSIKPAGSGFTLHYDPAIAVPIRAMTAEMGAGGEALLWHAYDHISAPTLLLRGETSDLLTAETAAAMVTRGPRAQLHVLAGIGHAPTLQSPEQVALVRDFLLDSPGP